MKFYILFVAFYLPIQILANSPKCLSNKLPIDINLKKLLPKDYEIFYIKKGNLNLDAYLDYAVILEKKYSVKDDRPKFVLQLYVGKANKAFQFVTENSDIVRILNEKNCKPCVGVNEHIKISNGQLNVIVEGGGTSVGNWMNYYFEYKIKEKDWYLNKVATQERNTEYDENDERIGRHDSKIRIFTKKDFGSIKFNKCESIYWSEK